jgi:hypothetical protein
MQTNAEQKQFRGGVPKDRSRARAITVWFRNEDADRIDLAVALDGNTDRSKFVRNAIRNAVSIALSAAK